MSRFEEAVFEFVFNLVAALPPMVERFWLAELVAAAAILMMFSFGGRKR